MDYNWQEQLQKFLKNENLESEEDLKKAMEKFNSMIANNEFEEELSPMAQAYDYLDKAQTASSKQLAIKNAKKALEICPECIDAEIFLINMDNSLENEKRLLTVIDKEEQRLKKEKYFDKENIGHFYGIWETRPYIRALNQLAYFYSFSGKINKAIDTCQKIIELNESDNTGSRFLLMALYSYKEDEKSLQKLYKKYDYECLESLIPFLILYLKQSDYIKAKEYLDKIDSVNKNFKALLNGNKIKESTVMKGFYSHGDSSEVIMYLEKYDFLMISVNYLEEFVKKNGKI